jgi:hypothetical protein
MAPECLFTAPECLFMAPECLFMAPECLFMAPECLFTAPESPFMAPGSLFMATEPLFMSTEPARVYGALIGPRQGPGGVARAGAERASPQPPDQAMHNRRYSRTRRSFHGLRLRRIVIKPIRSAQGLAAPPAW